MPAGLDADADRRGARLAAALGLGVGGLCLLAGAALYLGTALGLLPAAWTDAWRPAAARNLALAAVIVLGTILVSVGAVFAILEQTGVLAAAAGPRRGVQEPGSRRDVPAPGSRSGAATPTRRDPAPVPGSARDRRAGHSDAEGAASGDLRLRGAARGDRPNSRSAGASGPAASGAPPIGGDRPSRAGSTESADAGGPASGSPPSGPSKPAIDTAAARAVEKPPAAPQPGDMIAAWDVYRRDGDGHFSRRGLQGVLDQRGLAADVSGGESVGAGGAVLIVETRSGTPDFYVLPSFNKSPRAVANWFDDGSGGALTGRTQRVTRMARGRWVGAGSALRGRFEVIDRGEVA